MRFFPLAQNFCFAWGTWVARERGGKRRLWSLNPKSDPPLKIFFIGVSFHAMTYTGLQGQVG